MQPKLTLILDYVNLHSNNWALLEHFSCCFASPGYESMKVQKHKQYREQVLVISNEPPFCHSLLVMEKWRDSPYRWIIFSPFRGGISGREVIRTTQCMRNELNFKPMHPGRSALRHAGSHFRILFVYPCDHFGVSGGALDH